MKSNLAKYETLYVRYPEQPMTTAFIAPKEKKYYINISAREDSKLVRMVF